MFGLELHCSNCKRHTMHHVNPWFTEQGKKGGISTLCVECDLFLIHEIKKGFEITDEMLDGVEGY